MENAQIEGELKLFSDNYKGIYREREYWYLPRAIIKHKNQEINFDYYTSYKQSGNVSLSSCDARIFTQIDLLKSIHFEIKNKKFLDSLVNVIKRRKKLNINDADLNEKFIFSSNNNQEFLKLFTDEIIFHLKQMNEVNIFITDQFGIGEKPYLNGEHDLAANYSSMNYNEMILNLKLFQLILDQMEKLNWIKQ